MTTNDDILAISEYILATIWLHSGYILATFWLDSDYILTTFWINSDYLLTTFWLHSDFILTSFWLHSDFILASLWLHSCYILTTFWLQSDYILITFGDWRDKQTSLTIFFSKVSCPCHPHSCYVDSPNSGNIFWKQNLTIAKHRFIITNWHNSCARWRTMLTIWEYW